MSVVLDTDRVQPWDWNPPGWFWIALVTASFFFGNLVIKPMLRNTTPKACRCSKDVGGKCSCSRTLGRCTCK